MKSSPTSVLHARSCSICFFCLQFWCVCIAHRLPMMFVWYTLCVVGDMYTTTSLVSSFVLPCYLDRISYVFFGTQGWACPTRRLVSELVSVREIVSYMKQFHSFRNDMEWPGRDLSSPFPLPFPFINKPLFSFILPTKKGMRGSHKLARIPGTKTIL